MAGGTPSTGSLATSSWMPVRLLSRPYTEPGWPSTPLRQIQKLSIGSGWSRPVSISRPLGSTLSAPRSADQKLTVAALLNASRTLRRKSARFWTSGGAGPPTTGALVRARAVSAPAGPAA